MTLVGKSLVIEVVIHGTLRQDTIASCLYEDIMGFCCVVVVCPVQNVELQRSKPIELVTFSKRF